VKNKSTKASSQSRTNGCLSLAEIQDIVEFYKNNSGRKRSSLEDLLSDLED